MGRGGGDLSPGTRSAVRAPCGPLPPFDGLAGCSRPCARALSPPRALRCQSAGVLALCEIWRRRRWGSGVFPQARTRTRALGVRACPSSRATVLAARSAPWAVIHLPTPARSPLVPQKRTRTCERVSSTRTAAEGGDNAAAAIAREGGRERARLVRPPPGSRPSPFSSPPPAPRESRGAAGGGGGGGGGGGSPRGRVRPAPRRRSRHRRLSRLRNESLGEHGAGPAVAAAGIAEVGAALRAPPRLADMLAIWR